MNKFAKAAVVTVVAATGLATVAVVASPDDERGYCDRDGKGRWAMMMNHPGKHGRFGGRDLDLTADEAKTLVQARLIMRGNDRLKVGQVSEMDDETYLVDIVTVDDSLVRQVEIDRDHGFPRGPMKYEK